MKESKSFVHTSINKTASLRVFRRHGVLMLTYYNTETYLELASRLEDNSKRGSQGICIVLSTAACLHGELLDQRFTTSTGRVVAVRLLVQDTLCRNLYLVTAYAPVGNVDQSIWEEYLRNLDNCINQKRTNDVLVIGSDTASSMGCSNDKTCLGTFGISYVYVSGRRFASYLAINNLIAAKCA